MPSYRERLTFTGKEVWPGKEGEGPTSQAIMAGMRAKFAADANAHLANLADVLERVDAALHVLSNGQSNALAELRVWRDR